MSKSSNSIEQQDAKPVLCGIVMPISGFLEYSSTHWSEVRGIIERSIVNSGLSPRAVWESADTGIIHSRIINNLYFDEIVVVDASGLNPNVMFELGMRLTFKKPTVIIADDTTKLPFDTSNIEHIIYPKDLHFGRVEIFMNNLSERISAVREASFAGTYKPYLDSFGAFTVVQPEQGSVDFDKFVVEKLSELSAQVAVIRRNQVIIRSENSRDLTDYSNPRLYSGMGVSSDEKTSPSLPFWTPERLEILTDMWTKGHSSTEISSALGNEVSRNLIVMKANRLGLKRPTGKTEG